MKPLTAEWVVKTEGDFAMVAVEPLWESYRMDLAYRSEFAVRFRYPGGAATKEMAQRARRLCRSFRRTARQWLGLP